MRNSIRLAALAFCALVASPQASATVIRFSADLDAAQVVAGGGSTSTGTAFARVALDTVLDTVTTDLTWSGLSGPVDRAHLHDAPLGQLTDGNFLHDIFSRPDDPLRTIPCPWSSAFANCVPASGTTHDVLNLSGNIITNYGYSDFSALVDAFQQGGIYLDMHTELYPEGEIRGQMVTDVPEPSTSALLAFGVVALTLGARRRIAQMLTAHQH